MNKMENFSLKALEYVRYLSEEIGPRPSGSAETQRAQEYISGLLKKWGYEPLWQEFKFAPHPVFYSLNILLGILLIFSGLFLQKFPLITLFLPFFISLLPTLMRQDVKRRLRTENAKNLYAFSDNDASKPLLVLAAHVDSAPASSNRFSLLRLFNSKALTIIQRVAYFIAIISLFYLLGFNIPDWLFKFAQIGALVLGGIYILNDLYDQLDSKRQTSPGAFDNASGVSALLCLAEHFSQTSLNRLRLCFLFTDAEETGMHGARAFVEEIALKEEKMALLNLDMVGAGNQLCYVTKEGGLWARSCDPSLNQLLRDACPDIRPITYIMRSGDFAPFLENGLPAVSLETRGSAAAEQAYHHITDKVDVIEPRTLNKTIHTVIKFIEMLPYSDWTVKKP